MENNSFNEIILDIDGTIWNTTGIVAVAWNKAIEMSGLNAKKVNAQILQQEFGKTMDTIANDLWPQLTEPERKNLLSYCCTEEQIAVRNNTLDITYPGVIETVRELSASANFYIVSNCQNGYIELTLEKTGLAPFIRDYECFGRTGKSKAENIQILMARNRITSAVYIGDTQGDADACSQAGIPFIWAAYGFGKVSRCIEKLEKFSDLKKLLAK
ncbi:HAD family hydrolase [Treponema sp.]|uniref:HAD family hydrolase n=1 Tax=Treponema sp. TaxID=166 RepID=UPI003F111393